jgi:23S rRNA pseudouridine2605 synthase
MSEPQRLQRYLAAAGLASRRKSEEFILAGRIRVNGKVVTELGSKVVPGSDVVSLDGIALSLEKKHLFLFYKPAGILTTLDDPQGRPSLQTYTDSLPVRVFPVGRLDLDVFGLLLLTNDGAFAHTLLHPKFAVERRYLAEVRGVPTTATLARMVSGVSLPRRDESEGEEKKGRAIAATLPEKSRQLATLFPHQSSATEERCIVEIRVAEGRNHFVKRIFKAVGHPVVRLCRVAYGQYQLGNLCPGEIREVKHWDSS